MRGGTIEFVLDLCFLARGRQAGIPTRVPAWQPCDCGSRLTWMLAPADRSHPEQAAVIAAVSGKPGAVFWQDSLPAESLAPLHPSRTPEVTPVDTPTPGAGAPSRVTWMVTVPVSPIESKAGANTLMDGLAAHLGSVEQTLSPGIALQLPQLVPPMFWYSQVR